jgi:nitroimidazol reductase NimA-like FMN-containing flavoprotein (pyridoxamine 5'-phosphate oxidase superfamily)
MLRTLATGAPVCVTVTLLDGMVVARSAFHSSMNYRSVVILGSATPVLDRDRKLHAMRALVDNLIPVEWDDLRPITEKELRATDVLEIPLREASAKVRTGGPKTTRRTTPCPSGPASSPSSSPIRPVPDERLTAGITAPTYVRGYRRPTDA